MKIVKTENTTVDVSLTDIGNLDSIGVHLKTERGKTEKVSVNLSAVELGQIDFLVERGLFDNRSDFMRTAARKSLEGYTAQFEQFLNPQHFESEGDKITSSYSVGLSGLTRREIRELIKSGKKLHIRAIGLYSISCHATPEEIRQVVSSCKVYGKLVASPEVKQVIREIEAVGN